MLIERFSRNSENLIRVSEKDVWNGDEVRNKARLVFQDIQESLNTKDQTVLEASKKLIERLRNTEGLDQLNRFFNVPHTKELIQKIDLALGLKEDAAYEAITQKTESETINQKDYPLIWIKNAYLYSLSHNGERFNFYRQLYDNIDSLKKIEGYDNIDKELRAAEVMLVYNYLKGHQVILPVNQARFDQLCQDYVESGHPDSSNNYSCPPFEMIRMSRLPPSKTPDWLAL